MRKLVQCLQNFKSKNDIHRDLRPSNIALHFLSDPKLEMLTPSMKRRFLKQADLTKVRFDVKLINFRRKSPLYDEHVEPMKEPTSVYHSPQMLRFESDNPSVDVWALGCILCELVSGKTPFRGENLDK